MGKIKKVIIIPIILTNFIFMLLSAGCAATDRNIMPQFAGQDVPKANFIIDFDKRYNIITSQYQGVSHTYENVKIIGYTGAEVKEASGVLSKSYSYFNHWLVVERQDGRKVYLPMNTISILEEIEQIKK